ncbi:hypothetical protein [Tropicimonas sp. IMCC34043]|uniref:hypothetical protein n=1 Tax=Tropicimonas sp. IMCC34043 TaxID=2248760 RepID=UPI001300B711|nr:hypothetical protein [Tropicimonas sp. IMCC34043]
MADSRPPPGQGSDRQLCTRYPQSGQTASADRQRDGWNWVDAFDGLAEHDEVRPDMAV